MGNLYNLLNISLTKKELVCLVGGGGKTSTMFRLAKELSARGKKVLVTTTTAIYFPEKEQYDSLIVSEEEAPERFDTQNSFGITVLGRAVSREGKLLGVNPSFLDAVFLRDIYDYILVEGDGSKGRPVKAPAEHEPVVPAAATKVIGLIGLDCVGKQADRDSVHRPEQFCRLVGCREGDVIDTGMLVKLAAHKEGLFKAAPEQAQKYLVLNKADGEKEQSSASDIASQLRDKGCSLEAVITASMKYSSFRKEVRKISGIILASGLSKRMGENKLLLPVGGIAVIERVIKAASGSMLAEVVLVCTDEEIASIGRRYGATIVNNPAPQLGQSQSVVHGTSNSQPDLEGLMFLVGDQPFITSSIIDSLIESFSKGKYSAAVPRYNGHRGNPVIFSSELREKLLGLSGDAGGRSILDGLDGGIAVVEFDSAVMGLDMDTHEEYEAVLKLEGENG